MPFISKFAITLLLAFAALAAACATRVGGGGEAPSRVLAASPSPVQNSPITIAAVGDIMMASTYPDESRMPPNDGTDLLTDVTPILSRADITFGNLEGPLADSEVSKKCTPKSTRCFAFRVPTRYAKHLKAAGFDVMSLANNHAGDFGDAGRASTRRALDDQGIKHAGSDKGTFAITVVETKGKRVAFVAFAHNAISPNVNDLASGRRLISEANKRADMVVVSFHGGAEGKGAQNVPARTEIFAGAPRGNLRLFARTVIDAGADLVLGHGPHVLRGMEIYKERLIAYSLGNFCTYGWFQLVAETALTAILEVKLDASGRFLGGKIHAGRQEGRGRPVLDQSGESTLVIRKLSISDFGAAAPRIAADGTISIR